MIRTQCSSMASTTGQHASVAVKQYQALFMIGHSSKVRAWRWRACWGALTGALLRARCGRTPAGNNALTPDPLNPNPLKLLPVPWVPPQAATVASCCCQA